MAKAEKTLTKIDAERRRGILSTSVTTISNDQMTALMGILLDRLATFTTLVQQRKFTEALEMLEDSAAGDGYGMENRYLSFDDLEGLPMFKHNTDGIDLGCVLDALIRLQSVSDLERENGNG